MSCNVCAVTAPLGEIVMEKVREAGKAHGLTPATSRNETRASLVLSGVRVWDQKADT
jgi:hypothetical protein